MSRNPFATPRPRWRKVLSDIWENRSRTALVVASIAVGVFAIGMIITTYFILDEDMAITYSSSNPANIEIGTNFFDDDFLKIVERIPGVARAEGRHRTTMRLSADGGATWRTVSLQGIEAYDDLEIFTLKPLQGKSASAERELLVESRLAEIIETEVGQRYIIQLSDDTRREMAVVGVVQDQSVQGEGQIPDTIYVDFDTLDWLGQPQQFNRLNVIVDGDRNNQAHIEAVGDLVEEKIEDNGASVFNILYHKLNEHPFRETVLAILGILGVMGGLMLILGSSLISNTLNALLNQHLRQIGVMKLVGARSFQVFGMYLLLIFTFGMIALIISVPLGGYAGYQFAIFLANLLEINIQGFRFIPASIAVQTVIAVLIPIIAGTLPVRAGSNTTIENAISDNSGSGSGEGGWLDMLGETNEWISRPLLLSIRNTFRKKKRLMLTLFTLTMAGAIFIAVFNVQASLGGFIDTIGNLFIADVTVDFDQTYRVRKFEQGIEGIPNIERIEPWTGGLGNVELPNGEEILLTIVSPPAGSDLIEPNLIYGRQMREGDEKVLLIADTVWQDIPDLAVGDILPVSFNDGRADDWTVIGIFQFPGRTAEFIFTYAPYEGVAPEIGVVDEAASYRVVTTGHSAEDQNAVAADIDTQLRNQGFKLRNVETSRKTLDEIAEQIGILVSFFLGMAGLTAVVGSIGLAGTMSMNVLERTREIGVMRAIGAVDSEIIKSVIVEGMFIGVISWAIGAVLSFPISYGLLSMVSSSIANSAMPLIFSVQGFWLWLIVVLVLAALASIVPARNAARLTIREVLAYE
ncbi:MAG: ABC transporter permease [Candidatus Promineifilaceae bacterium]